MNERKSRSKKYRVFEVSAVAIRQMLREKAEAEGYEVVEVDFTFESTDYDGTFLEGAEIKVKREATE